MVRLDWFKYLKRKTSTGSFLPEIDGFRFFAIATVLLYHLNTHIFRAVGDGLSRENGLAKIMSLGSVGVDVFFAISGFILALPFARHMLFKTNPVNLKSYYLKRLTRLEPPYVISLVFFLVIHIVILSENFSDIWPNFLASLFYAHNIVFDEWSLINPVAWSLEVEVQFYALAPFLSYIFVIPDAFKRRLVMIFIIVAGVMHYNFNYEWIEAMHLRKSLIMHIHQFFIGFLFADIFLTTWRSAPQTKSFIYDVLGGVAMILLLLLNTPFNWKNDLLSSAVLLLTFICIFKGPILNKFYTSPIIVTVGGMCYSIYLLHYALIAFVMGKTKWAFFLERGYLYNFVIQAILIIPIVLLVSAVYFALIERPCMDKDWPAKLKAKILSVF